MASHPQFGWPHSELVERQYRRVTRYRSGKRYVEPSRLYVSFGDFVLHKIFLWAGTLAKFGMGALVVLGVTGALRRRHEEAWEAEHGRDTPAYREAEATAQRAGADRSGRDDWLLNPPKPVQHDASRPPKFGARRNSVQRGG